MLSLNDGSKSSIVFNVASAFANLGRTRLSTIPIVVYNYVIESKRQMVKKKEMVNGWY